MAWATPSFPPLRCRSRATPTRSASVVPACMSGWRTDGSTARHLGIDGAVAFSLQEAAMCFLYNCGSIDNLYLDNVKSESLAADERDVGLSVGTALQAERGQTRAEACRTA